MDKYAYLRQTTPILAKITVLLDDPEFRRLDAFCRKQGFKKSTLLARLTRDHLDGEGFYLQEELPLTEVTLSRGHQSAAPESQA